MSDSRIIADAIISGLLDSDADVMEIYIFDIEVAKKNSRNQKEEAETEEFVSTLDPEVETSIYELLKNSCRIEDLYISMETTFRRKIEFESSATEGTFLKRC